MSGNGCIKSFPRQPDHETAAINTRTQQQMNCCKWCFLLGPPRKQSDQSESEVLVRQPPHGGGVGDGEAPIVGSRCVAMPSVDAVNLPLATVNCKLCELVKRL